MLRSMTGFGRGEHTGKLKQVTVEIKAVNNRFGEVQIKIPYQYLSLEENIRRYVLSQVSRGRIDVYIKLKDTSQRPRELCRFVKQVGHDAKQDKIAENYN